MVNKECPLILHIKNQVSTRVLVQVYEQIEFNILHLIIGQTENSVRNQVWKQVHIPISDELKIKFNNVQFFKINLILLADLIIPFLKIKIAN